MFGLGGKDDAPQRVGAKEKLMKAQMLKRGRFSDHIESKGEGQKSHGVTILAIYLLSAGLAYILQIGAMKSSSLNIKTGLNGFDHIMFSGGVPSLTGNEMYDMILVPALRGFFIFLAAGILPVITLTSIRAIDRPNANPFIATWATTVGIFFGFFFVRDFFGPLLGQVVDIASPTH